MKKVAVIGTGIAGMASAYLLNKKHDVIVFEKNDYVGGHTCTNVIEEDGKKLAIDMGFIVFNNQTYPNLVQLFKELDVEVQDSNMSFSVQYRPSNLEYCGSGINGLFCQRQNLINIKFLKMIADIHRFNRDSLEVLDQNNYREMTVGEYFEKKSLGKEALYKYLVPMTSAIWSSPVNAVLDFPIQTLVRFAHNHGLLGLNTHHQWKTVRGGSFQYRDKLISSFKDKILTSEPALRVTQKQNGVEVETTKSTYLFEKVVLASHADESLQLISNPTAMQRELLKNFSYQKNEAILHFDDTLMPKSKKAWSAWNYTIDKEGLDSPPFLTYWMNRLQNLDSAKNYFVTLNGSSHIDPQTVLVKRVFTHPLFDLNAVEAQKRLHLLNRPESRIYFCGSYFKYGFHEDALTSAIDMMKSFSIQHGGVHELISI